MTIRTYNLNQAAMFCALGAKLIRIKDDYTQWQFMLEVNRWQVWYERHIGFVPYRRFCAKRVWLKEQHFKQDGKSTEFRGKQDGFLFTDVVRVVPFTHRERQRLSRL